MQVTFWGVRGSIPTPGTWTSRWGGNSSCLQVRHGDLEPLVFDAGTGIRELGKQLVQGDTRHLNLVFTHLHMDHLFGFPFFAPLFTPGYSLSITLPSYHDGDAKDKLGRYLNGIYHPLKLDMIPAEMEFLAIRPAQGFERGGFKIRGVALNHPGGATGYRVDADGESMCYFTDTAPMAKVGEGIMAGKKPPPLEAAALTALEGCDVVVFDTMFSRDEYLDKMSWGHGYPEYAVALCKAVGVKHLVLFHHSPDATDEQLDAQEAYWRDFDDLKVTLAREGETVDVSG